MDLRTRKINALCFLKLNLECIEMVRGPEEDTCPSSRLVRSDERLERGQCRGSRGKGTRFCSITEAEAAGLDSWWGVGLSEGTGKCESRSLPLHQWEEVVAVDRNKSGE